MFVILLFFRFSIIFEFICQVFPHIVFCARFIQFYLVVRNQWYLLYGLHVKTVKCKEIMRGISLLHVYLKNWPINRNVRLLRNVEFEYSLVILYVNTHK